MSIQSLTHTCKDCGGWFNVDDHRLERKLAEAPSGNFVEVVYCPNCDPGSELMSADAWGVQTPYQKEVCEIIAGEISMYENRIEDMKERMRCLGSDI